MLDNLIINRDATFSVNQVVGNTKSTHKVNSITKATTDKISDFISRNSGSVFFHVSSIAVGYAILGAVGFGFILAPAAAIGMLPLITVIALTLMTTIANAMVLGVVEGQKSYNDACRKLTLSMKHDQIIAFLKEVGVTYKDLSGSESIELKVDKKLTLDDIKIVFELDTGKKEHTKKVILDLAKKDRKMCDLLHSLMMEEKYRGFRDFGNELYDQEFDEAFLAICLDHSTPATDPVASAPAEEALKTA